MKKKRERERKRDKETEEIINKIPILLLQFVGMK